MTSEIATGDLEAAHAEIRRRAAAGKAATTFAADPNFYTCLVFDTAEQRDTFIGFLHMICENAGDDLQGARYLDGMAIARGLGIELPESPDRLTHPFKIAPKLAELAMTFEEFEALPLPDGVPEMVFPAPEADPLDVLDGVLGTTEGMF